jgi:hypothetical protein
MSPCPGIIDEWLPTAKLSNYYSSAVVRRIELSLRVHEFYDRGYTLLHNSVHGFDVRSKPRRRKHFTGHHGVLTKLNKHCPGKNNNHSVALQCQRTVGTRVVQFVRSKVTRFNCYIIKFIKSIKKFFYHCINLKSYVIKLILVSVWSWVHFRFIFSLHPRVELDKVCCLVGYTIVIIITANTE